MQKQYLENAEHLEKSLNAKLEGLFLVMTLQFFLATLKVGQPFEMKYLRAYIRIIKQLTLFKPGCARLPSGLTFRSSRPAFGGRLSFFVSPFIFRFYAGQHLFQRLAFLRAFSFGFLALCWASPACTAQVSCLFGLQRLHSKRHQLSFLQRCAASVAQRFFMGRVRLQGWAPPFGLRV